MLMAEANTRFDMERIKRKGERDSGNLKIMDLNKRQVFGTLAAHVRNLQ
jgi:hypothetical protein